ncbi:hypothetical protein DPMN_176713 [Dreissena polymorpha]|uniref:Uncharacterized protein n=1 Tax=Dreissena polymorpha TaxID=45954 RepID=A0A9D4IJV9_DREPO|nr:hypothetical protein DPMN_176713 [Dreissena polymorpha]
MLILEAGYRRPHGGPGRPDRCFLARNNSGQYQGAFKRPASKPSTAKNANKNNLFSKRLSSISHPAPKRPSFYNRPSFYQKSSGKDYWIRATQARLEDCQAFDRKWRTSPRSVLGIPLSIATTSDAGGTSRGYTKAHRQLIAPNNFGRVFFPCY